MDWFLRDVKERTAYATYDFMDRFILFLEKVKLILISVLLFLFPLFLLPYLGNFTPISNIYILAFGVILLIIISTIQLLISRKFILQSGPADAKIVLFVIAIILSILISSTNKMQALFNPILGLVTIMPLTILYFYLRKFSQNPAITGALYLSAFLSSMIILMFTLEPQKDSFTMTLDLLIFLGFMIMYLLGRLMQYVQSKRKKTALSMTLQIFLLIICTVGLSLGIINLMKDQSAFYSIKLSLYSVKEIFRNPFTAIFGTGIDNFSTIFTRIKDVGYNQAHPWQFGPENAARSTILHVFTESGILGFLAFSFLLFSLIQKMFFVKRKLLLEDIPLGLSFIFLFIILMVFPASLVALFLLMFVSSQTGMQGKKYFFDFSKNLSTNTIITFIVIFAVIMAGLIHFLGKSWLAEYYSNQSIKGIKENNFDKVYENQRLALVYNPYLERYHIDYSHTHFLLASNIANKKPAKQSDAPNTPPSDIKAELNKEDKQHIASALSIAIDEAQAAIDFNPMRAEYWAYLANIYNFIYNKIPLLDDKNIAKEKALSYYIKAMELDPHNAAYNLEIAQIYISQKKFTEASTYIQKAIELKPNYTDAHFGLAMSYFGEQKYEEAIKEAETTLSLLDPKENKNEYETISNFLGQLKTMASQSKDGMANGSSPEPILSTTLNKNGTIQMPKKLNYLPNVPPQIPTP